MRIIAYFPRVRKSECYFSAERVISPFFIMGRVSVAYFNLLLFGFPFECDEFLMLTLLPFCNPINHISFLCVLSQPNNTLARIVNTLVLNCSYAFFGAARNGVNHGGTPPVRLQAPFLKGCTAVPPVPPFLKLFFPKIYFAEKYYIEAGFLHPAPRTALRAL
jgi:hypothetical protein